MELVPAFEAHDLVQLEQVRLALESAGVPFQIEGEYMGGDGLGAMSSTIVRVPEDRLAEARDAIEDFLGRE